MISTFSYPTRVVFGSGAIAQLPALLETWKIKRPLLVADLGMQKSGLLGRVHDVLKGIEVTTFLGVDPNPVEKNVVDGVRAYTEGRCDGIVALGGGSPLDAAKIIRLRATHKDRPLADYDDNIGGDKHIGPNVPPMIAIPTTSGTGSEVSRSGVVTLESNGRKTVIFSPHLMPSVALLDPELTTGMPQWLTAATGVDALTHAVEAYISKGFHPVADAVALDAIARIAKSLPRACEKGTDLEARGDMMIAAMEGAMAFQKGLGACHSLAHPLSSECGVHHGLANAIMLPPVLRFNADAVPERMRKVAELLGGRDAATAVDDLCKRVGLQRKLPEVKVDRALIPKLVEKALQDGCYAGNPRPCTAADFTRLYEQAF